MSSGEDLLEEGGVERFADREDELDEAQVRVRKGRDVFGTATPRGAFGLRSTAAAARESPARNRDQISRAVRPTMVSFAGAGVARAR